MLSNPATQDDDQPVDQLGVAQRQHHRDLAGWSAGLSFATTDVESKISAAELCAEPG